MGFSPYLLSVTSRDLTERKRRWADEANSGRQRSQPEPYAARTEADPQSGIVALVDQHGQVVDMQPADGVQGIMALPDGRLLMALHGSIVAMTAGSSAQLFSSHRWYNDLHSLRLSSRGSVLLASSGTDRIFELDARDGTVRWSWSAQASGFDTDSFGELREVPELDHRNLVYDTWLHSTHLNSAISLGHEKVLCTLFHQGLVIQIDRSSGQWATSLDGLSRPHALRHSPEGILLCDTAAGKVLLGEQGHSGIAWKPLLSLDTIWLQDCRRTPHGWLAVDGAASRVLHVDESGIVRRVDQFDADWYLYETCDAISGQ